MVSNDPGLQVRRVSLHLELAKAGPKYRGSYIAGLLFSDGQPARSSVCILYNMTEVLLLSMVCDAWFCSVSHLACSAQVRAGA